MFIATENFSEKKIILYGAGAVGFDVFLQMRENNTVLAIADINYRQYEKITCINIISPECISEYEYDYVIIAIFDVDLVKKIYNNLINYFAIEKKKIIAPKLIKINNVNSWNYYDVNYADSVSKNISIIVKNMGGIGDQVIAKRWIVALYENELIDKKNKIYFICSNESFEFTKVLYSDCDNVKVIRNKPDYRWKLLEADIAIDISYIIIIDKFNKKNLENKKLERWLKYIDGLKKNEISGCFYRDIRVHFDKCRLLGKDQYKSFEIENIFDIEDNSVFIPLLEKARICYEELKLPTKFITVNFGWSKILEHNGAGHAKLWQLNYFNELILLIKNEFTNIKVIQLGKIGVPKIDNVDIYAFEYNIEIVKYILRDSTIHIDCEGGLVHIASQLGTKCAVLFGPTPMYYFGYKNNINISAGKCHDCCYIYKDFTRCTRELDKPECMCSITPDMVMKNIRGYLRSVIE